MYDNTYICQKVKKLTEGGGEEGGEGGGGGGKRFSIVITSSRCKLFCNLFVGELISCMESFKVPIQCEGGV